MLEEKPIAVLTSFSLGSVELPTENDILRICTKTDSAYIAGITQPKKSRKRESAVEKTIRETVQNIKEVTYSTGHVRFRAKLTDNNIYWNINLSGKACSLEDIKNLCKS